MPVQIPGLHFVLQAIDHTEANTRADEVGVLSLINTCEQVHAGWYGGGANKIDNKTMGVTPGCHYALVVYSTDPLTLADIRDNNYRFTLTNFWSNSGNYDVDGYYVFTHNVTQIADGEFMQLDGAYNDQNHYLRKDSENPDFYNININGFYSPGHSVYPTANQWAVIPFTNSNTFPNLNRATNFSGLDDDSISGDIAINLFAKTMFGRYDQQKNAGSTTDYTGPELINCRKQIFITKTPCLAQCITGMPAVSQTEIATIVQVMEKPYRSFNLMVEKWDSGNSTWDHIGTIPDVVRTHGVDRFQNDGLYSTSTGGFTTSGVFFEASNTVHSSMTGAIRTYCHCTTTGTEVWPSYHTSCTDEIWELNQGHIYLPQNEKYKGQSHKIDFKVGLNGSYTSFASNATNLIPWYIDIFKPGHHTKPYQTTVFDNIFPYNIDNASPSSSDTAYSVVTSYESSLHITITDFPLLPAHPSYMYNYGMLGVPGSITTAQLWKSLHKNTHPSAIPYQYMPNPSSASIQGGPNTLNYLDPELYSFAFQYMNMSKETGNTVYGIGDQQYDEVATGDRGGYYGVVPVTTGNWSGENHEPQVTGFVYNATPCPTSTQWENGLLLTAVEPATISKDSTWCPTMPAQPQWVQGGAMHYTYDGSLGPHIEVRKHATAGPYMNGPDFGSGGLITSLVWNGSPIDFTITPKDIKGSACVLDCMGDDDYEYWFVAPFSGCTFYVEQFVPSVAKIDCQDWILRPLRNCTNSNCGSMMFVPQLEIPANVILSGSYWADRGNSSALNGGVNSQDTGCRTNTSSLYILIHYAFSNLTTGAPATYFGPEWIQIETSECGSGVTHKGNSLKKYNIAPYASAGDICSLQVIIRGHEGSYTWPTSVGSIQGPGLWNNMHSDSFEQWWDPGTQALPPIVNNTLTAVSSTPTNPHCAQHTGSLNFVWQGGISPYTVTIIAAQAPSCPSCPPNNSTYNFVLDSTTGEYVHQLGTTTNTSFTATGLYGIGDPYVIRVIDDEGCCVEGTGVIDPEETITINSLTGTDPTTCAGVNGTITTNASTTCSISGIITYVWAGSNGGIVPAGQVLAKHPVGLTSGDYIVVATDPCGCTDSATITLGVGNAVWNLGFSNIHPSECNLCLGVIGIWINEPTLLTGSATYTIDSCTNCGATAGQLPATFSIPSSNATAWFFETFNQGVSAGFNPPGICVDSGSSPGVPAEYIITFDNGLGCTQTIDTELYAAPIPTVGVATVTCVGCNTSTCSITIPVPPLPPSPYNAACHVKFWYFLSETDYYASGNETNVVGPQISNVFTGLNAGTTYFVVIDDIQTTDCANHANASAHFSSCMIQGGTYVGTSSANLAISLTSSVTPCTSLSIPGGTYFGAIICFTPTVSGGTPPYSFKFTASDGTNGDGSTPPVFQPYNVSTVCMLGDIACNSGPNQMYEIQDANGCISSYPISVPCPPGSPVLPVGVTIVDASCTNPQAADGSLTSGPATGGASPYTYQWYTNAGLTIAATGAGNNSLSYTAALPGDYWLEVTDASGCTDSSGPHTVGVGLCDLCLSATKIDIACGGSAGSIDLTVDGANLCGTLGHSFTYLWSGPGGYSATTQDITGLATIGNYTVIVTDTTTGETDSLTIVLAGGADIAEVLTLTSLPPDCSGGCDGRIGVQCLAGDFPLDIRIATVYAGAGDLLAANYVTVQGGPFASNLMGGGQPYLWLGPDAVCDATQHSGSLNFPPGTAVVQNFCFVEGTTYYFQSVGANSCLSDVYSITQATHVATPIVLTETIIQPTCCGCTNSGCGTCNCNGSIQVIATGGNTNLPLDPWSAVLFEYDALSNGTFVDITADFVQAGNAFVTGIFVFNSTTHISSLGLYPGTYRITVTDGCGGSATETYIINDPKVYVADITTTDITCLNGCQDGTMTVQAYGGDSGFLQFSADGGLTWSIPIATGVLVINGVTYSNAASFTFLTLLPGAYDVWVRDNSACASAVYADPNDLSLCPSLCNGCYANYIYVNHHVTLNAASSLSASLLSFNNITLIGGSDGKIEISITGGVEPYDIAISCHSAITGYDTCINQGLPIPAGLNQFINLNGINVDASGITGAQDFGSNIGQAVTLDAGNVLTFSNLSLANDLLPTAVTGNYRIIVKDAMGCLAILNQELDNGLISYLNLYGAEDCNCNCPPGYVYQDPDGIPNSGDENCDGESSVQPTYNGSVGALGSIRQFIAPVNIPGSIVASYSSLPAAWYAEASLLPITIILGNTFNIKDNAGSIEFNAASGDILVPGPITFTGNIFTVGGTGWSRLWDNGVWLNGQAFAPIATPEDEWLYILIEVSFTAPIQTVLAVACDGAWKFDINCDTVITNLNTLGSQNTLEESQGYSEYSFFTLALPAGQYTLKFAVQNPSAMTVPTNIPAPAGIAFDLFQGVTSGMADVLTILSTANIGDDIDQYLITDINNVPISSRSHGPIYSDNITGLDVLNPYYNTPGSVTGQLYGQFLSSENLINVLTSAYGHVCDTGCLRILNGEVICAVADDQDCTLPLDCGYCSDPAYVSQGPCEDAGGTWTTDDGILSDLVECIGTMTNILYSKLASGLIENTLCIQDVWKVILIKYLIKNLNTCITVEDLVSWAKFLEDLCPSCDTELIVSDDEQDITPTNLGFDF